MVKVAAPGQEEASRIALKLLGYMAENREQLERFMALSGLAVDEVRQSAANPNFHAGLLDHALSDESLLLAFCANEGLRPEMIMQLRVKLPGFAT